MVASDSDHDNKKPVTLNLQIVSQNNYISAATEILQFKLLRRHRWNVLLFFIIQRSVSVSHFFLRNDWNVQAKI